MESLTAKARKKEAKTATKTAAKRKKQSATDEIAAGLADLV